tara:strand:+ start:594 stop:749 length:156 start_codon:yes stop_codon:yes gene_type:complete
MATWVYKDGKGDLVDAHSVNHHLDAGYTLDNKPAEKVKESKKEKKEKRSSN